MSNTPMDKEKLALINELVEYERTMFIAVPSQGGTSPCQEREDTFRAMRRMTHSVHDIATLQAFVADFKEAHESGRNLVTEKYARMDNLIPPLSTNPLLDIIADAEIAFMVEGANLYPHAMRLRPDTHFSRYLRCELETLSDATLEHYGNTVRQAQETGRNLAVDRYDFLWRELGHASLAEHEANLAAKSAKV